MRKITFLVAVLLVTLTSVPAFAQTTVTGNVKNSTSQENAAAVSITVKGSGEGTFTDDKGNFRIPVKTLPATLVISSIGFEPQEVVVSDASVVNIALAPTNSLGQE